MTNWEYLQSCDCEQAAHFLCDFMDEAYQEDICSQCPASNKCHRYNKSNGWFNWLMEEKK